MNGKLRNLSSLYLRYEDELLLLYRIGSKVISDSYIGTAGGHFEKEELNNARACVLRELEEETKLTENDIDNLSLRYVTFRLKSNEIRQNYYFFADLKRKDKNIVSNEGRLKWFKMNELADINMPYTAKYVVEHYLSVGKDTNELYVGIATSSGVIFTELKDF